MRNRKGLAETTTNIFQNYQANIINKQQNGWKMQFYDATENYTNDELHLPLLNSNNCRK